jgi:hypothetical protein
MANFLQTFDVDDGRIPCPLRAQTVTAPQVLFSMNDQLVERATTKLANRVLEESSGDLRQAAQLAFRKTIGRAPSGAELDRALTYVGNDPSKMKGLAWLLFNLDEFIFVK